jgi:hypothetical protein
MKGIGFDFDAFSQWSEHERNKMKWRMKVGIEWRPSMASWPKIGGRQTTFSLLSPPLWPQTVTTFPSVAPRRCRSMSLPSSSGLLVGENSMEGIRWLGRWKQKFKHPSTHRPAWCTTSLVTLGLTPMLHQLTDQLGGGAECPGMSPHLSHFVPSFFSYLIICLASWSYHYRCHDC